MASEQDQGTTAGREPGARWTALIFYAVAASVAVLAPLALEQNLTIRALRETAPLAGLVGGGLGFLVITRWPRSVSGAAMVGVLSAVVALVFFSAFYLFAEAIISAVQARPAGEAIAEASGRLWERLPIGALAAMVAFGLAGVMLRGVGAVVLARAQRVRRRPARRR